MAEERGKFLKVKCEKCNNEQIIFNKAATKVSCLVCNAILAEPSSGKATIKTKILHSVSSADAPKPRVEVAEEIE